MRPDPEAVSGSSPISGMILHGRPGCDAACCRADLIAEIKAEIARIDALKLGANLANRDFVAYQTDASLVALLESY